MSNQVYEVITNRIIELLEQGTVPWSQPWKMRAGSMPANLVSKKEYRGINILTLASLGFESPYFMSFKQARALGGYVRSGEKGFPVIFWKLNKVTDKQTDKDKLIPLLRYYTVFNLDQTTGIDESKIPALAKEEQEEGAPFNPIDNCQDIFDHMQNKPAFEFNGGRACYKPKSDIVAMPKQELFESETDYYSVLFHEMIHSTGHNSRLSREGITNGTFFGSHAYSKEELVAEMGSAMLCGITGIENKTINNSASYIKGWLSKLNDDSKLVIQAAGLAQKAADYIQNITFNGKGEKVIESN